MEQDNAKRKTKSKKVDIESETAIVSNHSITTENRMNGMSPLWRELYLKVGEKLNNN